MDIKNYLCLDKQTDFKTISFCRGEHGVHRKQLREQQQRWQRQFSGFTVANENGGGEQPAGDVSAPDDRSTEQLRVRLWIENRKTLSELYAGGHFIKMAFSLMSTKNGRR